MQRMSDLRCISFDSSTSVSWEGLSEGRPFKKSLDPSGGGPPSFFLSDE